MSFQRSPGALQQGSVQRDRTLDVTPESTKREDVCLDMHHPPNSRAIPALGQIEGFMERWGQRWEKSHAATQDRMQALLRETAVMQTATHRCSDCKYPPRARGSPALEHWTEEVGRLWGFKETDHLGEVVTVLEEWAVGR